MVSGSGEAPRMDPRHSADGARLLARTIAREVAYDRAVRREYCNLGIFVVYVPGVTADESRHEQLVNVTGVLAHVRRNVETIFGRSTCGNGVCEAPDEHPSGAAATRATEGGCTFDCGAIATVEVGVTFFDAHKYRSAAQLVRALAYQDKVRGFTPLQWGAVDERNQLLRTPAAGWNVCSRTDALAGHFEKVCVFDGDVFIDGLPYRTLELDVDDAAHFAAKKTASLYAGDWELVYAFANFSWVHPETGEDVVLAHPALRGELCVGGACELWAACPNAPSCGCQFEDGDYVCYDRDCGRASTRRRCATTPRTRPRDEFGGAYAAYRGFEAVAAWWDVPRSPLDDGSTARSWRPSRFARNGQHLCQHWSGDCAVHDLLLVPGAGFLGWAADVLEVWVSNATATDGQAALRDGRAHLAYVFELDEGPCAERRVFLCADKRYTFGFRSAGDGARRDTTLLNYELYFEGELRLRGAGPAAVEAGDCGALATDKDGRCVDHNASFCAYGSDVDAPAFCDPAREAYDASLAYARPYGPKALDRCAPRTCADYVATYGYELRDCGAANASSPSAAPTAAPTAGGGDVRRIGSHRRVRLLRRFVRGLDRRRPRRRDGHLLRRPGPEPERRIFQGAGRRAAVNGAATPNATATLESPEFSLNGSAYVSFLYSAYGDIARTVEAFYLDGGGWTRCFRAEWDQGAPWRTAFAALPATATKVRVALAASAWGNVVALDDVVVGRAFAAAVSANATNATVRCYGDWAIDAATGARRRWTTPRRRRGVVRCAANETGCFRFEYAWPAASLAVYFGDGDAFELNPPGHPETYKAFAGCLGDLAGALEASEALGGANFRLGACAACVGDLCNGPDLEADPPWYRNGFSVASVALASSLDLAKDSSSSSLPGGSVARLPLGVTTCDFGRWGDGFCDVDLHSLGCAYDGGDCCGDPNFGCAAPWYAADPADAWRYAVKTTVPVMSGCSAALAEVRAAVMSAGIQIDEAAVAAVAEVQIQATVPFALYFAALDRLRLEVAGDPNTVPNATAFYGADVERLVPSLACPECAEPSFTRRIPFTVTDEAALTTSNNGGGWNPEGNVMFPHLEDGEFRVRTFAEPAIVQHGLVVQQTRIEMATCPRRVSPSHAMRDPLENRCADYGAGDSDRSPFGNDPTFNVDSFLYRGTNDVHDYYSPEIQGRLRDTGLPYGFFYDGGAGDDRVDDFPVVFDTIINASRAEELLATLIEGAYVDAATGSVTLRLLTYNGETDAYTKLRTVFTREPSGLFSAAHDVSVLRVDYYANTPEHVFRGVVGGFVVALLALLGRELVEVRAAYAATGSVRAYAADASNAIDLGGYVVQILMIPAWVRANIVCFNLDIELKYDTHDADAVGRISRSLAATADLLDFFTDLDRVELLFGDYDSVCTLAIIALSIQLLKNVQFHPTFGMISRTIRAVAGILWFWLCMLVLMLLLYTFIGTLLLGQTLPGFADIPSTGVTLLAAMSGLYEYDRIDVGFYEQIYFWTWMLLAFFVMYNVLLAIIVEEHQKTATQLKRDPTPFMCRALCGRTDAGTSSASTSTTRTGTGTTRPSRCNFLRFHGDRSRRRFAAAARRDDDGESSSDGDGDADASPEEPEDVDAARQASPRTVALRRRARGLFAARRARRPRRRARAARRARAPRTFTDAGDAAPVARSSGGGGGGGKRARVGGARGVGLPGDASPAPSPRPFLELHFDTPGDGDEFSDDGSHHGAHGDDPPQAREATSSGPGA
ncbi:hypothetical protein JL720_9983 [Aureococcus anophagefferens]|nr:hypothetical protein JL720_9983 [Aureococcus anophagefferens]